MVMGSEKPQAMSPLKEVIDAYLYAVGFHSADGVLWGHPRLGEGRTFVDAVTWWIGTEQAARSTTRGVGVREWYAEGIKDATCRDQTPPVPLVADPKWLDSEFQGFGDS